MRIEINIEPNELAQVIVDVKYGNLKSKNFLTQVINEVRRKIEIEQLEIEELDYIVNDNTNTEAAEEKSEEKSENLDKLIEYSR